MFNPLLLVLILVGMVQTYGPSTKIARIKNESITESSGLVASRTTPGAYWTHNDSGDGPFIYAFDTNGETLGVFKVTNAAARDWEDISVGPGRKRTGSVSGRATPTEDVVNRQPQKN